MNEYESVIIIRPTLLKKDCKLLIKDMEFNLKKVSKIINKKFMGIKKLPYKIEKFDEGIYVSYKFMLKRRDRKPEEEINLIENYFRTRVEIIKFIVVKCL